MVHGDEPALTVENCLGDTAGVEIRETSQTAEATQGVLDHISGTWQLLGVGAVCDFSTGERATGTPLDVQRQRAACDTLHWTT